MRESVFKHRLIINAHIEERDRVLDLGCGTGTLTLLIKKMHPLAIVFGLDGDETVLNIAREKIARAKIEIKIDL